jgi:hypothetical protein
MLIEAHDIGFDLGVLAEVVAIFRWVGKSRSSSLPPASKVFARSSNTTRWTLAIKEIRYLPSSLPLDALIEARGRPAGEIEHVFLQVGPRQLLEGGERLVAELSVGLVTRARARAA